MWTVWTAGPAGCTTGSKRPREWHGSEVGVSASVGRRVGGSQGNPVERSRLLLCGAVWCRVCGRAGLATGAAALNHKVVGRSLDSKDWQCTVQDDGRGACAGAMDAWLKCKVCVLAEAS